MKTTLLSISLAILCASTSAQIVITDTDFPTAGTSFSMANDNELPLGFDLGTATATPQTWDFSILETDTLYSVEFYDPSSVDPNADFPNADIALDQFGGFAFAEFGTNDVSVVGIIADFGTAMGLPTPLVMAIEFEDPMKIFEFPSMYGTSYVDFAKFDVSFESAGLIPAPANLLWDPDSIRIVRNIESTAVIDAEGTLTDVLMTDHSVLRQFVIDNSVDSIWGYVDGAWGFAPNFPGVFDNPQITLDSTYRFIGQETGYIVATVSVNGSGSPTSATFISDESQCCTGVQEVEAAEFDLLYPNPTTGIINVNTGNELTSIEVIELSGRTVYSELLNSSRNQIDLGTLPNGLYLFKVLSKDGSVKTGRLSISK